MNNKHIVEVIFCELSKAFDSVNDRICIFVHEPLAFTNIDMQHLCMEQDI
jgi:hypothetical protein